jgi:hypothetical protein
MIKLWMKREARFSTFPPQGSDRHRGVASAGWVRAQTCATIGETKVLHSEVLC